MHIAAGVTFVIKGIVQSFRHGIFIQNPGDWRGDFSVKGFSVISTTMLNILKCIQKLPPLKKLFCPYNGGMLQ